MKRSHHTKRDTTETSPDITPHKKAILWGVMLFLPLAIFLCLELGLRIAGFHDDLGLVVTRTVRGKEYYTLNRTVARRYFSGRDAAVPDACDDLFAVHKGPHTRRIFMLGESTMAGFPFEYNATAPRLLQDRLQQLLPDDTLEVVNVGLAAINSYVVRDLMKELIDYQPDAFAVYLGHNEFVGPYSVASANLLGRSRGLVNFYLSLRSLKTVLLLRDLIAWGRDRIADGAGRPRHTLMEAMAGKDPVRYGSDEYRQTLETFVDNYRDIIREATSRGIPIVISTVASNVRDQKPLLPCFAISTTPAQQSTWSDLLRQGTQSMAEGHFKDAQHQYAAAVSIDSTNAEGQYRLAQALDSLGLYDQALAAYRKARDFDGMRFRATDDWNVAIRSLAREEHVTLADADSIFSAQSPHGIVGANLMLEHVHPNADGYFLLAKTFFQSMADHAIPAPKNQWHWDRNLTDAQFKEQSGVTRFDLDVARARIFVLTHNYPFMTENTTRALPPPLDPPDEIAQRYARSTIPWSDARYAVAKWYTDQHRYPEAMHEYLALAKVAWYSYHPWMQMGDVARMMERPDTAESLYHRGLTIEDTPFLHVRLGMLYFEGGRTADAVKEFEETFRSEARTTEGMDSRAQSTARYFLAAAYGKSGNITLAKSNLQMAVQIDPNNVAAKNMLAQLQ